METREVFEARIARLREKLEERYHVTTVFAFPVNVDENGKIEDGVGLFTDLGLLCVKANGADEHFYPFCQIADARYEGFFGGAACEILFRGEWIEFCRICGEGKHIVSQLIRNIKEVCDGVLSPGEARFFYRHTVCPRCRRPYAHGSHSCPHCAGKTHTFKKLFGLVKPQLWGIILSMVLFFLHSLLSVYLPVLQRDLVDGYLKSSAPQAVLDSYSSVLAVILSMMAVRVGIGVSAIVRNNILAKVSAATVVELRRQLYEKVQSLSVAGIFRHTAGDLMNRISQDTNVISQFLTSFFPSILEQLFIILFVGTMLFAYSWRLAFLILIPVPFVIYLYRLVWRRTQRLYRRQWMENSNSNTVLHDVFQGVRQVKVYGTEKNEIEKYDRAIFKQREISVRNEVAWAKLVPYADYLLQAGNFILLYYAGNEILKGSMTIGELTMFTSLVSLIYTPLKTMATFPRRIQRTVTAVNKVYEVIDEEVDVADSKNALDLTLQGNIEVDRIWFGYDENENVLEDVSVSVSSGEMLGIVGRSGVGKSTLINLIMRLYDVQRGQIRIDGVDIRDISQHSLRSQIGVVLQETFLFSGTIFENLTYAKPDATYEEVLRAARLANAHGFIMKLPDGYETMLGENGYTLSGGERQRIAIARAILHDPKILILDEATSALDTETEHLVQDALANLCRNRTTIAIAHRLSTLRNATKLLVLDKKKVAEVGTHEELIQNDGGIYQSLVIAQREMGRVKKTME